MSPLLLSFLVDLQAVRYCFPFSDPTFPHLLFKVSFSLTHTLTQTQQHFACLWVWCGIFNTASSHTAAGFYFGVLLSCVSHWCYLAFYDNKKWAFQQVLQLNSDTLQACLFISGHTIVDDLFVASLQRSQILSIIIILKSIIHSNMYFFSENDHFSCHLPQPFADVVLHCSSSSGFISLCFMISLWIVRLWQPST